MMDPIFYNDIMLLVKDPLTHNHIIPQRSIACMTLILPKKMIVFINGLVV